MKVLVVIALVCSVAAGAFAASCPRIVTRSQWGARPPVARTPLAESPTPYTVVHHAESASCNSQSACSALVRSFQDQHIDINGWSDIGYSFLIGEDGNVYEGRGWDLTGAHAPGYNSISIGICMIGSFTSRLPNQAALNTLQQLIDCGVSLGKIQSNYDVIGHRQAVSTDCPGDRLYQYVTDMAHWVNV